MCPMCGGFFGAWGISMMLFWPLFWVLITAGLGLARSECSS